MQVTIYKGLMAQADCGSVVSSHFMGVPGGVELNGIRLAAGVGTVTCGWGDTLSSEDHA